MQNEIDKLKEKFQEQQKANAEALAEERQARKKAEAEAAVTNEKKKQQEAEVAAQAAQKRTNKLIQDSISLLNKQTVYFKKKYSLQGTTQGRYLTGGVPPVRFSM